MRLDTLAAAILPGCDPADCELTAQWAAFICLLDDRFDRRFAAPDAVLAPVLAVWTGESTSAASPGPVEAAADLWRRTAPRLSDELRERFVADYTAYARATRREDELRGLGRTPDLAEYVELRRHTITVLPLADISECTSGAVLPESSPDAADLRTLRLTAADAIGWTNDLKSAAEDRRNGHANLVTVLARARSCSINTAHDEALHMRNTRLHEFRSLAHRLDARDGALDETRAYIVGLSRFVDASLYWLGMTGRFEPGTA
ncbi:terpene synthase family protein [Uniformispora flossi]|uniref:terpene synthase family protein n=1 Tax=Uniformispora flossi TaxID=3390723 RepID=UPI003C302C20